MASAGNDDVIADSEHSVHTGHIALLQGFSLPSTLVVVVVVVVVVCVQVCVYTSTCTCNNLSRARQISVLKAVS